MKLALTGAHGTGKTTLTNALRNHLLDSHSVSICREVPRLIIDLTKEDEFFRRGNNTLLRQSLIFLYQAIEDHLMAVDADIVITDRTMIDHLAYTLALFPAFPQTQEYVALREAIASWMQTYDYIFKLPIEFDVIDDGVREGDADFQRAIDKQIDALYQNFGIEPIDISGSVGERVNSIVDFLARAY